MNALDIREKRLLTAWLDARSAWRRANGSYNTMVTAAIRAADRDQPLSGPTPDEFVTAAEQIVETARAVAHTRRELDELRHERLFAELRDAPLDCCDVAAWSTDPSAHANDCPRDDDE